VDINVKYRAWYLAQSRDAWVNSGLQDPTGAAGNFLGQDVQVRLQWRPSLSFTIDAGYEHFFKGSYIKNQTNVPGYPPAQDTNYFYVQTEVRFWFLGKKDLLKMNLFYGCVFPSKEIMQVIEVPTAAWPNSSSLRSQ
jgi:alginate export protein